MSDVSIEVPQPAQAGPRIPRREAWVDLPSEYAGFRLRVWLNAPATVWNDLTSGDEARMVAAMARVALEHNGWCDFDGAPYPQPDDKALWDVLPTELIAVMITAIQNEMQKLPNSMRPQRRR